MEHRVCKGMFSLALLTSLALGGCGGGGGSSDSTADKYTASTEPVTMSTEAEADLVVVAATEVLDGDLAGDLTSTLPTAPDDYLKLGGTVAKEPQALILDAAAYALGVSGWSVSDPTLSRVARAETYNACETGSFTISETETSVTIVFDECVWAENTINGSILLTLKSESETATQYTMTVGVSYRNLTITGKDDGNVDGSMQVTMTFKYPDGSTLETLDARITGSSFYVRNGTEQALLTNFDLRQSLDATTEDSTIEADYTIASTEIGGSVTVDTTTPFLFVYGYEYPTEGTLIITGAGNAKVRLTAQFDQTVAVEYDLDGDGVYEPPVSMTWAELEQSAA